MEKRRSSGTTGKPKGMAFGHHAVGKVQRFKLREILERELAGKE